MRRAWRALLLAVVGLAWLPGTAHAQTGLSVAAGLVPVDFGPEGVSDALNFRYEGVAYGLVVTREGLHAAVHVGNTTWEGRDLDLFDINLSILGSLLQNRLEGSFFEVPVMLHSTYRRIRRTEGGSEFAAFEYTGLGLGVGAGARHEGDRLDVVARVVPGIGIATRSFGASGGRTTLVDGDIEVRAPQVFGRYGLVLGYGLRWQGWRVGGPDAFDAAGSGKVTYDGTTQSVRIGVRW